MDVISGLASLQRDVTVGNPLFTAPVKTRHHIWVAITYIKHIYTLAYLDFWGQLSSVCGKVYFCSLKMMVAFI